MPRKDRLSERLDAVTAAQPRKPKLIAEADGLLAGRGGQTPVPFVRTLLCVLSKSNVSG
jgi:hypothetical protein